MENIIEKVWRYKIEYHFYSNEDLLLTLRLKVDTPISEETLIDLFYSQIQTGKPWLFSAGVLKTLIKMWQHYKHFNDHFYMIIKEND
jgi:hypothetical protein